MNQGELLEIGLGHVWCMGRVTGAVEGHHLWGDLGLRRVLLVLGIKFVFEILYGSRNAVSGQCGG